MGAKPTELARLTGEEPERDPAPSSTEPASFPSGRVFPNCTAFPAEAYAASEVPRGASPEEAHKWGLEVCKYLGCGGFRMDSQRIYFLKRTQTELVKGKREGTKGWRLIIAPRTAPDTSSMMFTIVPMGLYCTTARFLEEVGWRTTALPLDWSSHTFKVWNHMIEDNYTTLLQKPLPNEKTHPYTRMFQDTFLFFHQGFFATPHMPGRVTKLKKILEEQSACGLAIYFEGSEHLKGSTKEEVIEDAKLLASPEKGFHKIILIWFERHSTRGVRTASCTWNDVFAPLHVCNFSPSNAQAYSNVFGPYLEVHDQIYLARQLQTKFHDVFKAPTLLATERRFQALDSDEELQRVWPRNADTNQKLSQVWDFQNGKGL